MCKAVLDEIRDQIVASKKFPPDKKGREGEEPFNLSAFLRAAFGKAEPKKWKRKKDNPDNITLKEALLMADAVGKPLHKILILAEERMSKEEQPKNDNFLNDDQVSA